MSSPITKIAIVGFTGKIARLITTSLLSSHPAIQIHGICRSPSKVSSDLSSNPSIKLFPAASNDAPALRAGLAGTQVCICCYLGDHTLMIDGQKTLIDACIAEKVPRYIASDYSLDFRGLKIGDHPNKDPMKVVQAYLEGKEKETEGKIKGVHVLNGAFMEVLFAPFLGFVDAKEGVFNYWENGDGKLDATTYEDTAKFVAEVAADEKAVGFLKFLGDSKSPKELAQIYQKVYNVEPKVERLGSLAELKEKMTAVFNQNPQNNYAWMGMFYQYYMSNGSTTLEDKLDNGRYPSVKPVDFEGFMRKWKREEIGMSSRF